MTMKLKNMGKRRIRLDRNVYLGPNQIIKVSYSIGRWAIRKHNDIVNITLKKPRKIKPTLKPRPKVKNTIKLNLEVKKNDIK